MNVLNHLKTAEDRLFWLKRLRGAPENLPEAFPRIIFHAASLGELNGVFPFTRRLRECGFSGSIIISVGTPTAYRKAKGLETLDPSLAVVAAPLEIPISIRAFVKTIKPRLFVNFEAEYWPMLFSYLRLNKIPAILVNGRISRRSFIFYRSFSQIFRPIFGYFSRLGMVSQVHRDRAILLGASLESTFVSGNSKYDDLYKQCSKEKVKKWREKILKGNDRPVIVAGNLRGKECHMVLNAIEKLKGDFPDILAIMAPRHLNRIDDIIKESRKRHIRVNLLSTFLKNQTDGTEPTLLVVDSFGLLFDLYSIADVAFCGGTFEPIGGHNIVEPAVWGKRVLYGPSIHKVEVEHGILEKWGIGILCRNLDEFLFHAKEGLMNREPIEEANVLKVVGELSGASRLYASWVMEFVENI
ncbi:MAG: hypothetical protein N2260_03480 [Syntrophobacterales bacterium]|nr:hypothetical protein [Syntrophobacterales bacterium]